MNKRPANLRQIVNSPIERKFTNCYSKQSKIQSFPYNSLNPAEENIILYEHNPRKARQLLQSEAEKLLEEGWEVICISNRSYIAVQNGCEIYLHTCSKGISARIFNFNNSI